MTGKVGDRLTPDSRLECNLDMSPQHGRSDGMGTPGDGMVIGSSPSFCRTKDLLGSWHEVSRVPNHRIRDREVTGNARLESIGFDPFIDKHSMFPSKERSYAQDGLTSFLPGTTICSTDKISGRWLSQCPPMMGPTYTNAVLFATWEIDSTERAWQL